MLIIELLPTRAARYAAPRRIASLSFKPPGTIQDGNFIPQQWTLDNYRGIFKTNAFTSALINSIGIGLIATFIAVILGTMAAYAVARLDFPGKKVLVGVALLIAMFPQISLVSPLFEIMRSIGLFDTWAALIIPYITFSLPLAIYTLSAFFREIPWELEKAAKMDGATPAQVVLAWHLASGNIAIPKSVTPERIRENLEAVNLALTPQEMEQINELDAGRRLGADPATAAFSQY